MVLFCRSEVGWVEDGSPAGSQSFQTLCKSRLLRCGQRKEEEEEEEEVVVVFLLRSYCFPVCHRHFRGVGCGDDRGAGVIG